MEVHAEYKQNVQTACFNLIHFILLNRSIVEEDVFVCMRIGGKAIIFACLSVNVTACHWDICKGS